MNNELIVPDNLIKDKIHTIRGLQVMLDSDLAELYDTKTSRLNEQVKRNIDRFPKDFMFQLEQAEIENLISQIATSSSEWGGKRKLPYAFTEQGVAMLSSVLKSKKAVEVNIQIMRAFVAMRKFISKNAEVFMRLDYVEQKQLAYQTKTDNNFEKVFKALEIEAPKQGIFFDGQVFDAYTFVSDLIRSAKKSIILVDNYVDDSVLTLFIKRRKGVSVLICTKNFTRELQLDLNRFNSQYEAIEIKEYRKAHDRFMIIDDENIYHIGASLKDLGKKWFAFSKIDKDGLEIIKKLRS